MHSTLSCSTLMKLLPLKSSALYLFTLVVAGVVQMKAWNVLGIYPDLLIVTLIAGAGALSFPQLALGVVCAVVLVGVPPSVSIAMALLVAIPLIVFGIVRAFPILDAPIGICGAMIIGIGALFVSHISDIGFSWGSIGTSVSIGVAYGMVVYAALAFIVRSETP